jgi:coenzyme F420-0:L-glutamate ligase/coenzyme F420-1:gamma-L-glutamate ligase
MSDSGSKGGYMPLVLTPLPGIPMLQPGDDLAAVILKALDLAHIHLQDGDVMVLAQKIVSKVEGRIVSLAWVEPSSRASELAACCEKDPRLVEWILRESREVLRVRPGTIVVEHRLGFVCANAGIDHSNVGPGAVGSDRQSGLPLDSLAPDTPAPEYPAEDWVLLLPENPDASAQALRQRLETANGLRLGVMIIDSHGRAWRLGTVGATIGLAGIPGLVDLRGQPDLFGYRLRVTQVGAADELAAAASLVMGQANEGTPVVHVRGFPYSLREACLSELLRPKSEDLFR